jgi:translation initiation factor IF-3
MDGDKVKVTVMFRGRELAHRNLGRRKLDEVSEMLGEIATVENPPRMEGRFLSMIMVPNRDAVAMLKKQEEKARAADDTSSEADAVAAVKKKKTVKAKTPAADDASSEADAVAVIEKQEEKAPVAKDASSEGA